MKYRIIIAALAVFLAGTGFTIHFCKCRYRTFEEHYAESGLIFSGKAARVAPAEKGTGFPAVSIEFGVYKVFKGERTERLQLRSPLTNCHFRIEEGEEYLIFARWSKEDKAWVTNICSASAALAGSEALLRKLEGVNVHL